MGLYSRSGDGEGRGKGSVGEGKWSRGEISGNDMLYAESKVADAFERLATRINGQLEYPEMLAEDGVEGSAVLDLYFDGRGEVEEAQSLVGGNTRLIRGLFSRAVRKALVEWLALDAVRLRKDQFRNQHYRASFVLSQGAVEPPILKLAPASFGFSRKRISKVACIENFGTPTSPALMPDFACISARIGGALYRGFSAKYDVRFAALKDMLEEYDRLGLSGVNEAARGRASKDAI